MGDHSWEVIIALASALQALTLGIIRYLLRQIDLRDERIEKLTDASSATNKLNEKLATLYVEQQERQGRGL